MQLRRVLVAMGIAWLLCLPAHGANGEAPGDYRYGSWNG